MMGEMDVANQSKPARDGEVWDMRALPVRDGSAVPDSGGHGGVEGDASLPIDFPVECTLETVTIGDLEIFAYEASRPDGTAAMDGVEEGEVCSRAGVRPWTNVTVGQAEAICATVGFRLCTDPEWETACRGEDQLQFPYGRAHEPGVCNDHVSGANSTQPAGSYPGCRTATGIYDLSGNVWEITAGPSRRGASFRVYASSFRAEAGDCISTFVLFDDYHGDDLGFRCCRSPG